MATKPVPPTTTMQITEITTLGEGDHKGDLVISVLAKRGDAEYRLPFHIARRKVAEIDLEALKLKVIEEIDAREAEQNQYDVVVAKLRLQQGKTINLN